LHKIFNYILRLLYLGCQLKKLPIKKRSSPSATGIAPFVSAASNRNELPLLREDLPAPPVRLARAFTTPSSVSMAPMIVG
jgi:hypothetical protein